ncbi:MAG: glycosyltransferase, partial [Anaerolineae bacterium]
HFRGLPTYLKQRYGVPTIHYDGDLPASLPRFQGFASGFRHYQGADLSEYSGFISNSKGAVGQLEKMGARNINVLYYAVDPEWFRELPVVKDIDVFFYGHGYEYRRDWIETMIAEPSRRMAEARFAIRATDMNIDLGNTERLPYMSLSKLREYCCRSKINLNITREAHASVHASSTSRTFELAAMGCCIVSNPVKGMEEWFEVGEEIVMVNDGEEVAETYRRLLSDGEQRRKMGQRARERVLREHTYRHRANQLLGILESFLC